MKSFLIPLSVAALTASIVIGVRERDLLAERLENLLGSLQDRPRPMLMGAIGTPNFRLSEKRDRIPRAADMAYEEDLILAQAAPAPQATPPAAAPAQPQQPAVDESALRYFASRGDKARLQAEISRLRALYPNWTPPADPLAIPQNVDRQLEAMWQLYAEARYAELRKAIADRQTAEPGWQPPADLLDRLDVAEARARLINASDLKQYETVVEIGAETPSLLTCSEVDVLWRVAEAFANTKRSQRARDAYLYILKNCENPAERIATVQKAAALLPYPVMQDLLSQERPAQDGTREFENIRDDLARRFVAEANEDPKLEIAPDYLTRVEHLVETQGLASDSLLLGWYNLRRDNIADAEKWFRMARAKEDSASASQGLALALIARKAPQEAEDVMYRWRDSSKDATATYLAATANLLALDPPIPLQPDVLQRIAAEVTEQRDPVTAQQFGWYARALNQPQTAARWFETALRWKPDDESSAYGLAITRNQLNDRRGVAEIQRLWQGKSERIANLGETAPAEAGRQPLPGVQLQEQAPAAQAPAIVRYERPAQIVTVRRTPRERRGCATTIDPGALPPADALARGWCLMDLNRPMEAASAFQVALRSPAGSVREDAAYGQSLAYLRVGLTSKAAVAAAKAPLSRQRASELQVSILAGRATAAFDAGRYKEALMFLDQRAQFQREPIDLMVLRGYAYMSLKMYGDANRIFQAAASTGNRDAMRGLADIRSARFGDHK